MAKRIELPKTPQGTGEEQLRAMYSYLYQMAVTLNSNLAEIGGSELTDDEMKVMREVLDGPEAGSRPDGFNWREAETLKSMIIKTAQFVRTAIDEYNMKLIGTVEAEGTLGRYVRNTGMDVAVNPEGITQRFSFQEIIQGLKTFEINSKNYIKSGLLRTEQALPVYGVAIGKDIVTFSEDGTETYNDGNKVAELTADELSFWQNQAKIASYTGDKISFLYRGDEVFYILNGKIYTSGDMQIGAGKKLEIVGNAGIHIQTNGKLQIDSGQLQIDGDGNATFRGTLAAAVVQALVLTGNQIQGGTLTLGGANNGNGRMVIQNANGQQIGYWDNTGLHVNEGEITGNAIKGGTLTLGGANNTGGRLVIKNDQGQQIGYWDNTGLHVDEGEISGGAIYGGTINAEDVTIINLDADQISTGHMSADRIQSGTLTLGGADNGNGRMVIQNAQGQQIGYWDNTGLHVDEGVVSGSAIQGGTLTLGGANNGNGQIVVLNANGLRIGTWNKDGIWAKGSIEAGAWKFDSNGAKYTKNSIYAMGLGDYANSPAVCGGAYFYIDQTTGTGSMRLVSKNYNSSIINYVELTSYYDSTSGTYRGRLQEAGYSGSASVDFGGPNNPWYNSYMVNIHGNSGLHLYPGSGSIGLSLLLSGGNLIFAPDSGYQNMLGMSNANQKWHTCYFGDVHYDNLVQNSSREIKHDIQDMDPVGEKLDKLRPVTFVYNEDPNEKKRFGLIYEETQEVMPEICTNDENNKAVNYVELIPMLLKEIQQLRARVKALEERG